MVSRCNLKPYLFCIWKMTSRRTNEFGANWAEQNAGQHIQARILRERICLRTTSSHLRQVFLSFLLTGSCVHVGTDGYDQHIFRQKLSTRTRGCMGSLQLLRIASWRVQFPKVIRYTPNLIRETAKSAIFRYPLPYLSFAKVSQQIQKQFFNTRSRTSATV